MAISLRGTNSNSNVSTSCPVSAPTGLAVGDLMIVQQGGNGNSTFGAPTGWTQYATAIFSGTRYMSMWYKIATSADVSAGSFTFTNGSSAAIRLWISAWVGVNNVNPLNSTNQNTQQTVNSTPPVFSNSVTQSLPGSLLYCAYVGDGNPMNTGAMTSVVIQNNDPGTWAQMDNDSISVSNWAIGIASGSTGTMTTNVWNGGAVNGIAVLAAFNPAVTTNSNFLQFF